MVNSLLSIIKLTLEFGKERGIYLPNNTKIHNVRQSQHDISILTGSEQEILERYLINNKSYISLGILIGLFAGTLNGGSKNDDIYFVFIVE